MVSGCGKPERVIITATRHSRFKYTTIRKFYLTLTVFDYFTDFHSDLGFITVTINKHSFKYKLSIKHLNFQIQSSETFIL